MTTKFFFVRHGKRYHTKGDPGLTEEGIAQAKMVGKYLTQFSIQELRSSPLLRTKETAKEISNEIHLPILIDERLRERINWGDDPSHTFQDFLTLWKKTKIDRLWQPPVGKSSVQTGSLVKDLIAEIHPESQGIVFVSHGGTISDFLRSTFSTEELDSFFNEFHRGWDENIPECSITEVHKTDGGIELIELAKTL